MLQLAVPTYLCASLMLKWLGKAAPPDKNLIHKGQFECAYCPKKCQSKSSLIQHERAHVSKKDKHRRFGVAKVKGPPDKKTKITKDLNYMQQFLRVDVDAPVFDADSFRRGRVRILQTNPTLVMLGDSESELETEVAEMAQVFNGDRLQLTDAQKIMVLDFHHKEGNSIQGDGDSGSVTPG